MRSAKGKRSKSLGWGDCDLGFTKTSGNFPETKSTFSRFRRLLDIYLPGTRLMADLRAIQGELNLIKAESKNTGAIALLIMPVNAKANQQHRTN